jgi:hypothetical protein
MRQPVFAASVALADRRTIDYAQPVSCLWEIFVELCGQCPSQFPLTGQRAGVHTPQRRPRTIQKTAQAREHDLVAKNDAQAPTPRLSE